MKLMITDDEPYIVRGLATIIKELKTPFTEIFEAFDGFDALEKMEKLKPDLLITDIKMLEMDGFELIKRSKERGLCDRFVILTGFEKFEYAQKALRYHVIDYLLKPVQKAELDKLLSSIAKKIRQEGIIEDEIVRPKFMDSCSDNVRHALEYIHRNYFEAITLETIGQEVGLHPNYFSYIFRKETGVSFHNYLNEYRIEMSKKMLLSNNESISNIASKTGFADKRHFFKVFKKITEQTPGQYRECSDFSQNH